VVALAGNLDLLASRFLTSLTAIVVVSFHPAPAWQVCTFLSRSFLFDGEPCQYPASGLRKLVRIDRLLETVVPVCGKHLTHTVTVFKLIGAKTKSFTAFVHS